MIENCTLGEGVIIRFPELCNIYGCTIGAGSFVGPFVEIQRDVTIGDWCKIESHTFICSGVEIGNRVFVGHGVTFTNDLFPAIDASKIRLFRTMIGNDVVIGSGATILPVAIGDRAIIGAGAVVTKDVAPGTVMIGNPARGVARFSTSEERDLYFAARKRDNMHAL